MGYEVDFLSVGNGECGGDGIALRVGNLTGSRSEQSVVVIDGGYQETGEQLVEFVKTYYKTDYVDVAVSTHPDNDHSGGLSVVVEKLNVGELWMHKPWEHTQDIAKMFKDGRVSDMSVAEAIRKSLDSVRELERIANRKKIPIIEPFTGTSKWGTILQVVGPTPDFYQSLLSDFRCTPEAKYTSVFERLLKGTADIVTTVAENWNIETLTDGGVTSAENNSSAILLFRPEAGHALLLTADAGVPALSLAADILDGIAFDYNTTKMIQMPHHGSRRNVGPTILNRLLGNKKATDGMLRCAYVSAPKDGSPKHPAKRVMNAFRRRGAYVYGTMDGQNVRYQHNAPARPFF